MENISCCTGLYWLTLAISKRQRRKALSLTAYTAVKSSKTEKNFVREYKKENDINRDKWIGVGGKLEQDESPEECLLRETYEETGLTLTDYRLRGVITFVSDRWDTEHMFLYKADDFTGELKECDEGELVWVDKEDILSLSLWEGDKIFLKLLMAESPFFTLKLCYAGDTLVESKLGK